MLLSNRLRCLSKLSIAGTLTFWCIVLFMYSHSTRTSILSRFPAGVGESSYTSYKPKIPQKIWYKVGPQGKTSQSREWMDDCLRKNPSYASEIITDQSGERFIRKNFAFRPDIIETYLALSLPIHRADFLRYLILFAEGGIWFDPNVSCEDTPINNWIPRGFKDVVSLVVGLEFDAGYDEDIVRQFATWTIVAAPRSPHILRVIDDIVDAVREATQGGDVSGDTFGDVVNFTGPGGFTRGIFKSLGLAIEGTFVKEKMFNVVRPVLVEDVMIMPGYSFAASINTYDNPNVVGPPLVRHHNVGS